MNINPTDSSSILPQQYKQTPHSKTYTQNGKNESVDQEISIEISLNSQILLAKETIHNATKDNALAQTMIQQIIDTAQPLDLTDSHEELKNFNLEQIGHESKSLLRVTQDDAKELMQENGFLSQESTSQRIVDEAMKISNGKIEILHEIREGLIDGFETAEKILDDELSSLAYQTQYRSLESINQTIDQLSIN